MQRAILLLWSITLTGLAQQACNTRQQATDQPADSMTASAPRPAVETAPIAITGRLAGLGLTHDSHWRGLNLGDAFSKVGAIEKGESFERDATHVGYTVELANLETSDVLYYRANGKVSAIDVDLFLNNRQSVGDYQRELTAYFTQRYGTPKPGSGGTIWNGPAGEQVTMQDVSKGKDYGLKIKIVAKREATTASIK